jgi:hypothetical protein
MALQKKHYPIDLTRYNLRTNYAVVTVWYHSPGLKYPQYMEYFNTTPVKAVKSLENLLCDVQRLSIVDIRCVGRTFTQNK